VVQLPFPSTSVSHHYAVQVDKSLWPDHRAAGGCSVLHARQASWRVILWFPHLDRLADVILHPRRQAGFTVFPHRMEVIAFSAPTGAISPKV